MNKRTGTNRTTTASSQRGLTLVELLISVVLGLILSAGVVRLYIDSKHNYAAEEEMARMQENGRYTLHLLTRELTMAGLFGGTLSANEIDAQAISTDCAAGNWALDASIAIEFTNNHDSLADPITSSGTTLTCLDGGDIQPDTDILTIKRTAGEPSLKEGAFAAGFTASSEEQWYLRFINYGNEKEWSKIASEQLQDPNGPFDPNDMDTQLSYWEAYTKIFFVRKYSESAADGIPTLCVQSLESDDMVQRCLVEGIEELQIEFGIDSDGDNVVNRYTATPTAAQMSEAVVARVYLLVRSIDPLSGYQNTKSYQLGQRAIGAKNDGFMRRVFSTTVLIRNATLPVS